MRARRVDAGQVKRLFEDERARFVDAHPRSLELYERGKRSLLAGVPMPWMTQWAGPFPLFVEEASSARFTCVDGHEYADFCLGDTGAMTGHAPLEVSRAITRQVGKGITLMLPTEDSAWVGEELARRFGLSTWQFCLTATDANRFTIRIARELTGRPKILVYSWCYHGTVDETFIILENGEPASRDTSVGPPVDVRETTRVVEWNDLDGLEAALAHGDVACVLAEPALTNIGIVLPEPGYHRALRELTRRHGTYLVLDETHTLCAGPGGCTGAWGLEPDFVTVGKAIASGVPAAAYGMSAAVAAEALRRTKLVETSDVGGIGGTLSGNALSLAAMRATLEMVLTEEAFDRMIALGEQFEAGVRDVLERHRVPWHVTRLGCRVEYAFSVDPPRTGGEAAAAVEHELDRFLHLWSLNRGILMTPFHNMALMSPSTSEEDVDLHTRVFEEAVAALGWG